MEYCITLLQDLGSLDLNLNSERLYKDRLDPAKNAYFISTLLIFSTTVNTVTIYRFYLHFHRLGQNLSIEGPKYLSDFLNMFPSSRLGAGVLALLVLFSYTVIAAAAMGTLVNPSASPEAKALMSLLMNNKGKNVISGQMSNPQDGASGEWFLEANVLNNIHKAPALGGFDFMNFSPSRLQSLGPSYHYNMTQDAITWSKRGGIVAFVWHVSKCYRSCVSQHRMESAV